MAEEIKVLHLDQENKVIYANVLITQALFYCIRRSVSVFHLCYHIHGCILQAHYIFHLFILSNKHSLVTLV